MDTTFTPLYRQLPYLSDTAHFMLKTAVPKPDDADALPAKHVCWVLDTSGSMKDTFPSVKRALARGIAMLRPEDFVSILSYSSDVKMLCEWNKCTDAFKESIVEKLDDVRCDGESNLSGALLQAIDQSMKVDDQTVVVFFTDGKANVGVTDLNRLGVIVKKMVPERGAIHMLGVGTHDPVFLQKISEASNGQYHFVDTKDKVQSAFIECIGKTMEVAYQNIKLTLQSVDVHFERFRDGKAFKELHLGDIHIGETRKFVFTGTLLVGRETYEVPYKIEAVNILKGEVVVCDGTFTLTRGDDNTEDSEVRKQVDFHKARPKPFSLFSRTPSQVLGVSPIRASFMPIAQSDSC